MSCREPFPFFISVIPSFERSRKLCRELQLSSPSLLPCLFIFPLSSALPLLPRALITNERESLWSDFAFCFSVVVHANSWWHCCSEPPRPRVWMKRRNFVLLSSSAFSPFADSGYWNYARRVVKRVIKGLKTFYCFNRISFFVLFIKFASFMNNKRATELFYFRFFFVVWLRFWCWRGFCENSSCLCFVSLFFVVFPRFECQNFFPLRFLQLFMCLALFRHFIWTALGLSLKRNHRILTNRPEQNVCQTIGNGKTKIGKKFSAQIFFFGDEIYSAIEKAFN